MKKAPLVAEPPSFKFSVPNDYVAVPLRGEGSETMRTPAGARVEQRAQVFSVEAGSEFALEVRFQALASTGLDAQIRTSERVLQDGDALVFKSGAGYWFVVSRELVPEWDESDRRSVTCSSAGATVSSGKSGGEVRSFSRSAVEHMVAACRTLALPELE